MLEKINKISSAIREARIVSISALIFTLYMTYEFLQWVMTADPTSLGEAVTVTGVMSTLVALVKFIFEFAARRESNNNK